MASTPLRSANMRNTPGNQGVFGQGVAPDYEGASNKIRALIARVTLRPAEEGFKIEFQGRLALLMGASNLLEPLSQHAPS